MRARLRASGRSKREIEGPVLEVSATSITIDDARTHGPVTALINDATVIRHGNRKYEATDIKAGDRVHVRANVEANGDLTAIEIKVQNPADDDDGGDDGSGGQVKELEGLITAVSETSITVANASTHRDETAAINANTVIRRGNRTLTVADLQAGNRVHVKTEGERDSLVALEIRLQN